VRRRKFGAVQAVLIFFVLTYAFTWLAWLPMVFTGQENGLLLIVGTFGPTLVALLLTGIETGRAGLRDLLRRLLAWRVGALWYVFSFLMPPAVVLAALGIHALLGGEIPPFNDPGQLYLVIPVFLYVLFLSVLGEEIGWRGYALPRLQARGNALVASLVVGLVWGLWHLPTFFTPGNFHKEIPLSLFVLQDVALAIVLTWMYNGTGGSLVNVHLFHAATNTTLGVLPILPMDTGGELRPLWIAVGLLWFIVLLIVAFNGPATLARGHVLVAGSPEEGE
jgi:membrane protease YdiL (CAAX protease family)